MASCRVGMIGFVCLCLFSYACSDSQSNPRVIPYKGDGDPIESTTDGDPDFDSEDEEEAEALHDICLSGCRIGAECVPAGERHPEHACLICDPERSSTDFSPLIDKICRPAVSDCDAAERCDGISADCPPDGPQPDGLRCDDSNRCTRLDICMAGQCTGLEPVSCVPVDQCHEAGECDPLTGECSQPPRPNDTRCDDRNLCTTDDLCTNGICVGLPKQCPAAPVCRQSAGCNPETGYCDMTNAPIGQLCDDGDPASDGESCLNGMCVAPGCQCAGVNECCDGCMPVNAFGPCQDGDACTGPGNCLSGVCITSPITCIDFNLCTRDG